MATLREYFLKDLEGYGIQNDLTLSPVGGSSVTVLERVNFETRAGVNFVSYLFEAGTYDRNLALYLIEDHEDAFARWTASVHTKLSHSVSDPEGIDPADQPFSGRMFIYADDVLPDAERSALTAFAEAKGVRVKLVDRRHADFQAEHEKPWAFISHDSRDKEDLARPLAEKLSSMICPVWYDEYSMKVGQSLRESIDAGIRDAGKCIVLLSPNFFSNPGWTKAEFNAVMGKHINAGGSVILPVWHNVSRDQVFEYSTMIADVIGLPSSLGTDELARRLFLQITPGSS